MIGVNKKVLFLSAVSLVSFMGYQGLYAAGMPTYTPVSLSDANWDVQVDANGMPTCLELKSNPTMAQGAIAIRHTREDVYTGTVEYSFIQNWDKKPLDHPAKCSDADNRGFAFLKHKSKIDWVAFPETIKNFYGVSVPPLLTQAVHQLLFGGYRFASLSAADYLAAHPIQSYDRDINRQITQEYNVEYSSSIFRAWIEAVPANQSFADRADKYLEQTAHGELSDASYAKSVADSIQARLNKPVLFIARYLSAPEDSAGVLQPFMDDMNSYGFDTRLLDYKKTNGVDANAALIKKNLDAVLESGRDVILLGASKGTPDALTALANYQGSLEDPNRSPKLGKVIAYANFDGCIQGSVMADLIMENRFLDELINVVAKPYMKKFGYTSIDSFSDLTTQQITKRMEWVAPLLPQKTVYMNMTGIPGGQGYAYQSVLQGLQKNILRKFGHGFGANDGYLEYPGSVFPQSMAKHVMGVTAVAGHALVDGSYRGLVLANDADRRRVLLALMQALTDEIELAQAAK